MGGRGSLKRLWSRLSKLRPPESGPLCAGCCKDVERGGRRAQLKEGSTRRNPACYWLTGG